MTVLHHKIILEIFVVVFMNARVCTTFIWKHYGKLCVKRTCMHTPTYGNELWMKIKYITFERLKSLTLQSLTLHASLPLFICRSSRVTCYLFVHISAKYLITRLTNYVTYNFLKEICTFNIIFQNVNLFSFRRSAEIFAVVIYIALNTFECATMFQSRFFPSFFFSLHSN